jgi:hypothetical protein
MVGDFLVNYKDPRKVKEQRAKNLPRTANRTPERRPGVRFFPVTAIPDALFPFGIAAHAGDFP